jgi:hypothetical protein
VLAANVTAVLSDMMTALVEGVTAADASTLQKLLQSVASLHATPFYADFIMHSVLNISKLTSRDLLFPDEQPITYSTSSVVVQAAELDSLSDLGLPQSSPTATGFIIGGVQFNMSAEAIAGIKQSSQATACASSATVAVSGVQWLDNPVQSLVADSGVGTSLATLEFTGCEGEVIPVQGVTAAVSMRLPIDLNHGLPLRSVIANLTSTVHSSLPRIVNGTVERMETPIVLEARCDKPDVATPFENGYGVDFDGTAFQFHCGPDGVQYVLECTDRIGGYQVQCPTTVHALECVFWDEATASYSNEGCEVVSYSEEGVVCRCNHLTSFAAKGSSYATQAHAVVLSASDLNSKSASRGKVAIFILGSIFFGWALVMSAGTHAERSAKQRRLKKLKRLYLGGGQSDSRSMRQSLGSTRSLFESVTLEKHATSEAESDNTSDSGSEHDNETGSVDLSATIGNSSSEHRDESEATSAQPVEAVAVKSVDEETRTTAEAERTPEAESTQEPETAQPTGIYLTDNRRSFWEDVQEGLKQEHPVRDFDTNLTDRFFVSSRSMTIVPRSCCA